MNIPYGRELRPIQRKTNYTACASMTATEKKKNTAVRRPPIHIGVM